MAKGRRTARGASNPASIVVAVGATAARISALETFLSSLHPHEGIAVVVVLQHREALDVAAFERELSRFGRSLTSIEDGLEIEAGKLYLPPADIVVTVDRRRFRTRPAEQQPGERGTIDRFLTSLARDEDGHSIAVILDGTGGDGTLGLTAIKAGGGLTLAEEAEEFRDGHLSASKSPAALADFVLPVEALAERIACSVRDFARQSALATADPDSPEIAAALAGIVTILRNRTGQDFHGYKRGTFLRRVQRRMQVAQIDTLEAYAEMLRSRPDEAQLLFKDLLIGVTQFFRDPLEFEVLEREVIPKLFEGKTRADQLRVWVIGCSTGEEAYSLGILLREYMLKLEEAPQVQIFGSDLDGRALASARAARYSNTIVKDVPPERLARWFVKEGDTYCVAREVREMCIFSQHSLVKNAPFSRLDLVSCRNLLIYLDTELQTRVIPLFHFALKPGGYLFLGNSENVSRHTDLFEALENRFRIFRRVDTSARTLPDFPLTSVGRGPVERPPPAPRPRALRGSLAAQAERIAERHAPAYVIVDAAFDVLHFSGRTGPYLEPAGGIATLNVINLVHADLRLDLRAALTRARDQRLSTEVRNVAMSVNGSRRAVGLAVEPLLNGTEPPLGFVVLFKDSPLSMLEDLAGPNRLSPEHENRVQQLEAELSTTNEYLQAAIEELESTNEELKSSNEEYQSFNEELQAANEELETSKEELQSVNEELTTVNGELAHRVQELGRANSDLKNLLESTQIATIFLDNEMRVTNYTPAVTEVFHLVESDIGRPIGHIKGSVGYEALQEDVQRVKRTLGTVERDVRNPATGTSYMVRVLPYRSLDNFIGGVVVTLTDVTPLTQAQEALRQSEGQARMLVAEVQHRVRNTLSVVRSIARRTAETSDTIEDYAMHLEGRLDAFTRVQAAVSRNPIGGLDLEMLIADELLAAAAREGEQVGRIRGPKVRLQAKAAETLALAIHELATNAVKYGALSRRGGSVQVAWNIEAPSDGPRLKIQWRETGVRPNGERPARRGFGTEMIERTLVYELGAETSLDFGGGGLHCIITLPYNDRVVVMGERR
jgi:two-component system CheB/CheR fusion protein